MSRSHFKSLTSLFVAIGLLGSNAYANSPDYKTLNSSGNATADAYWAPWIEKDFPFISSVLEIKEDSGGKRKNLTPRSLILNLGGDFWMAFDVDLLRISALWQGNGISLTAMAPGTYLKYGWKTKGGEVDLPQPQGDLLLYSKLHPGWEELPKISQPAKKTDPRERGFADEFQVGLGPLPLANAQFLGIKRNANQQAEIHYRVKDSEIHETWQIEKPASGEGTRIVRSLKISPSKTSLLLLSPELKNVANFHLKETRLDSGMQPHPEGTWISEHSQAQSLTFIYETSKAASGPAVAWKSRIWEQTPLPGTVELSKLGDKEAYVKDDLKLPFHNPWKRHVRLADITFLNNKGEAAAVTYDGDVWLISGLTGNLDQVKWSRFASGLHEPMAIIARQDEFSKDGRKTLYVYDKNGIWRLLDEDKNGEVDFYQMFSNQFAQSAETRDYANSMKLAPDGSFVVSKGGQQETYFGKHNGTIFRISKDGKYAELLGHGFRQPFIGVHPVSGLITASDQEGHYVPTTPISLIEKGQFYGHIPSIAPKEKYPTQITEPVVWIPHTVNASALTQTWLVGSSLGDLEGEMIHVGYNFPELFRVLWNNKGKKPQAAVISLDREFPFAPFNVTINPADGTLFATGFQSWGTVASQVSGLQRLRYTGKPKLLLKQLTPMKEGVLLEFNAPLDQESALQTANYSIERWNYQRTHKYGSPHLKLDGSPGQDWMHATEVHLSKDRKKAFVALPDMKAGVQQMRIGWLLKSAQGHSDENTAYFTPHELLDFKPESEGFKADLKINLSASLAQQMPKAPTQPTVEEGYKLSMMMGCMACHSIDNNEAGKVGPSWKGLYGIKRQFSNSKAELLVDESYLKESIVNPSAKIVKGFEKFDSGMPIYNGVLNDSQIHSIILYIKSLK